MSLFPPTTLDNAAWKILHQSWLGASVRDLGGHQMGPASASKNVLGLHVPMWRPGDGHKHVLVGEVDRYHFYNPSGSGDEADFNIYITPNPVFSDILSRFVQLMKPGDRDELHKRTGGVGFCLEAEITPDESYYDNNWLPTNERKCSLVGKQIAVYGPWVMDLNHGGRPEIHPAEAIWWRDGAFDGPHLARWQFIFLQDDSNRFDRESDYDGPVSRPWSAFHRRAHATVALQAFRGKTTDYHLNISHKRRALYRRRQAQDFRRQLDIRLARFQKESLGLAAPNGPKLRSIAICSELRQLGASGRIEAASEGGRGRQPGRSPKTFRGPLLAASFT